MAAYLALTNSSLSAPLILSQHILSSNVQNFRFSLYYCTNSFPVSSVGKESTCNVGDLGWIPGLGRSPGEGNSYPLQYSGLENFMDYIVHGVAKRQTRLSDFPFHSTNILI